VFVVSSGLCGSTVLRNAVNTLLLFQLVNEIGDFRGPSVLRLLRNETDRAEVTPQREAGFAFPAFYFQRVDDDRLRLVARDWRACSVVNDSIQKDTVHARPKGLLHLAKLSVNRKPFLLEIYRIWQT
jgi:hypothetical protein